MENGTVMGSAVQKSKRLIKKYTVEPVVIKLKITPLVFQKTGGLIPLGGVLSYCYIEIWVRLSETTSVHTDQYRLVCHGNGFSREVPLYV